MIGLRRRIAWLCLVAQAGAIALPLRVRADELARAEDPVTHAARSTDEADLAAAMARVGRVDPPGDNQNTGIALSALGLAAGAGLAVWLKSEADDRYDDYLRLADPDRAREARRSAQRYDRASLIGWGAAEVSFLALFYFVTRERERPLIPVEGEPIVRADAGGIQVGIRVAL